MAKTVLYIEDNLYNRELVKRVLEAEHYQVMVAETGLGGIDQAVEQEPDLVILDISLPDIDGYEVARRLRLIPRLSKIPILALTAHVMKGDRERSLEAGCDGYIQKPVDVDRLPSQVEEYMKSEISP